MSFPPEVYRRRRLQVRKRLQKLNLDGLLVMGERNVRWLTGFTGDSTWLLCTPDGETLISDFRFATQIEEECPGVPAFIRTSALKLTEAAARVIGRDKVERLGFEGQIATVELMDSLASALDQQTFVPVNGEIELLRAIKGSEEIAEIMSAVRLAERAYAYFQAVLAPQRTERELAADLEHAVRNFGGEGFAFPAIIAVGDRAALPHYRPGDKRVEASPMLLLDWGVRTQSGYCSDLTRTMLTRKGDKRFEKVYKTVLESQRLAIETIRPGVTCGEVDAVARDFITAAGYGENFDHGLGHGFGLDVHEQPRLSRNSQTVLQPGMVVTVEPGIYLPGWGGVRIEDNILVTRHGAEVLSSVPKEWEAVLTAC
jgi:Xaa-Pro aminopeptidase